MVKKKWTIRPYLSGGKFTGLIASHKTPADTKIPDKRKLDSRK